MLIIKHDLPSVQANPHFQGRTAAGKLAAVKLSESPVERERGLARAEGVVLLGQRRTEERHQAITGEVNHNTTMLADRLGHQARHTIKKSTGILRIRIGNQFRRIAEVGKEYGEVLPLAASGGWLPDRRVDGRPGSAASAVRLVRFKCGAAGLAGEPYLLPAVPTEQSARPARLSAPGTYVPGPGHGRSGCVHDRFPISGRENNEGSSTGASTATRGERAGQAGPLRRLARLRNHRHLRNLELPRGAKWAIDSSCTSLAPKPA